MLWLMLVAIALVLLLMGNRLSPVDEVYALAVYSAVGVSALWGFALAPTPVQIILILTLLVWLQMLSRQTGLN